MSEIDEKLSAWLGRLGADGSRRRWVAFACGAFTAAVVLVLCLFLFDDPVWSVGAIDRIVKALLAILLCVFVLLAAAYTIYPQSQTSRRFRRSVVSLGSAAFVIMGLYVGYASFRNQTQISAEASVNEEGMNLYALEVEREELRCLYFNYRAADPVACLDRLIANEGLWSLAIFYVEEGWFLLGKSQRDRLIWGSQYGDSIDYWAADVARDPTGLFTYYAVASEAGEPNPVASARRMMDQAHVCVPDICAKFNFVRGALERAKVDPGGHNPCIVPDKTSAVVCSEHKKTWK